MDNDRISELSKYHDILVDHKLDNQKEYQKIIMGLSGGALTISMTFSDNIISTKGSLFNIVLVIGWALLLLTILLQVYYTRKVTSSTSDLITKLKGVISKKEGEDDILNVYIVKMTELELLNKTSTLTMLTGLLFISLFFSINFIARTAPVEPSSNCCTSDTTTINCNRVSPINIQNNPVFINNNGKMDTTLIKKYFYNKPKHKNPCD